MRALPLCLALLLTATALAPGAAAHDDPPEQPGCDYGDNCPDPCPFPPVVGYLSCATGLLLSDATAIAGYGVGVALYGAHQVGCHVVGGPACPPDS